MQVGNGVKKTRQTYRQEQEILTVYLCQLVPENKQENSERETHFG
jgi:hypothetical protein